MCYNGNDKKMQLREHEQICNSYLQFGLFSETRKHEAEIVSNRKLVRYGEFKIKFCTHRPSRSEIEDEWEPGHFINMYSFNKKIIYTYINR